VREPILFCMGAIGVVAGRLGPYRQMDTADAAIIGLDIGSDAGLVPVLTIQPSAWRGSPAAIVGVATALAAAADRVRYPNALRRGIERLYEDLHDASLADCEDQAESVLSALMHFRDRIELATSDATIGYEITDGDGDSTCRMVGCDCADRGPWPLPTFRHESGAWLPGRWHRPEPLPRGGLLFASFLNLDAQEGEATLWIAESRAGKARLLRPHPDWSFHGLRSFAIECMLRVQWVAEPWTNGDERIADALQVADWLLDEEVARMCGPEMARAQRGVYEAWEEIVAAWDLWNGFGAPDDSLRRYEVRHGSIDPPDGADQNLWPGGALDALALVLDGSQMGVALAPGAAHGALSPKTVTPTPLEDQERLWQENHFCDMFGLEGIVRPWGSD
jgi:hypothetical protein